MHPTLHLLFLRRHILFHIRLQHSLRPPNVDQAVLPHLPADCNMIDLTNVHFSHLPSCISLSYAKRKLHETRLCACITCERTVKLQENRDVQ